MSRPARLLLVAASAAAVLALTPAHAATPAEECLADLAVLPDFLRDNDAGARDHLARKGPAHFDAAYAEARRLAAGVESVAACQPVLSRYVRAYRDTHIEVGGSLEEMRRMFTSPEPSSDAARPVADVRAPTLRLLSKQTALLVIPSFFDRHQSTLRALLEKNSRALASRPNLIVDVRDNNGGSDGTYEALIPWLAAPTTLMVGVEFLATPENLLSTEQVCDWLSAEPAACRTQMAPVAAAMRAGQPGEWVRLPGHGPSVARRLERTHDMPRRVAILIDRNCGSSCEQFLLDMRQSYKVKLFGRPTHGGLDCSNLRPHLLPSGQRSLFYATSRSMRLPALPVDVAGVQPDVLLPKPVDAAGAVAEIDRVRQLLEAMR
jgi:hypothetical protein